MPNSPASDFRAEKRSKTRNSIVPQSSALAQEQQEARSPHSSPQLEQQRSPLSYPQLPSHLSQLIDQPWSRENSLKLDQWHWYCQQEFEVVGGWQ